MSSSSSASPPATEDFTSSASVQPIVFWHPPVSASSLFDDDQLPSHTSREQLEVERRVEDTLRYVIPNKEKVKKAMSGAQKKQSKMKNFFGGDENAPISVDGDSASDDDIVSHSPPSASDFTSCPALCEFSSPVHIRYVLNGLLGEHGCHPSLDASRPWLLYWTIHALDMMDALQSELTEQMAKECVKFIARCVNEKEGGVGGGPGQQPHTATTYAAVLTLAILTSHPACADEAIALLRAARAGIYSFHLRCKIVNSDGSCGGIRVSRDGEADTRGVYTVISVAALLHTLTPSLQSGVGEWLGACQTYEGGLGGEWGNEAHGGYTFCGLAAAILVQATHRLDMQAMLKWATRRQMEFEGGFQGRTNKLVDGCYSFWVGALFPLIQATMEQKIQEKEKQTQTTASTSSSTSSSFSPLSLLSSSGLLFDTLSLQRYLLVCCQMSMGGLRDKPGKHADLYHTCYCMSGLAVAQHANSIAQAPLLGKIQNRVSSVHPLYNIRSSHVDRLAQIFANQPI